MKTTPAILEGDAGNGRGIAERAQGDLYLRPGVDGGVDLYSWTISAGVALLDIEMETRGAAAAIDPEGNGGIAGGVDRGWGAERKASPRLIRRDDIGLGALVNHRCTVAIGAAVPRPILPAGGERVGVDH